VTSKTELESVVIRLAGDSGDGMQLMGSQFVSTTAKLGNDFATFPDYPAEIRAPVGTTFGVSAYQINLGSISITTAGDEPQVLVAFNPAALKVNLATVAKHATILLNSDAFNSRNLSKAGYDEDPRTSGVLDGYNVVEADITRLTLESVKELGLSKSDGGRCKNLWALGLLLWMFDRDTKIVGEWLEQKFAKKEIIRDANLAALRAGHIYGETAELSVSPITVKAAEFPPGEYRSIMGDEALALGLAAAAEKANKPMMFCGYPITPASSLLHRLSRLGDMGVGTFQAEDEIAAVCSALGASFGGAIGVTASSGPGIALKTEALGLAVNTELPLVVVNAQRGGPSTGLPTKTEQSDLYQAVYGRNGDTPIPVLATRAPGDCFYVAIEAVRIALRHMTPVILLTDGYLQNAAEPWEIPDMDAIEPIESNDPPARDESVERQAQAFTRNPDTKARPWIPPGTPDLMHRIGGIEKDIDTGHICYDSDNHAEMSRLRADKVKAVADFIPKQAMELGNKKGRLLVIGWGSTYGPIFQAVKAVRETNPDVSYAHITYINPFPKNLGKLIDSFDQVMVPEMNMGQMSTLLKDRFAIDPISLTQVTGQPFRISALKKKILATIKAMQPGEAA
jgi:2-oxoglutarate/2-oxoacid ferredoxin oxidoreductase subunit alpha